MATTRRRRLILRWLLRGAMLVVLAGVLAVPGPAQAHALLVSSDPAAGANLPTVPAVVTLVFDEPLVASLSDASVKAPDGERFAARVSGERMVVRLGAAGRGVYRVSWKTVSKVDGHVINGSFQFGVGAAAAAAAVTSGPTAGDIVVSTLRGIEYALLLLACGICLLGLLGRGLALRQPVRAVSAALLCAGVLVVLGEIWLAGSGLSARGAVDYLTNDRAGWARTSRLVLEAALLLTPIARRRISAALLGGIIVAVALAGHGADVEPAWQGIAVNAAHLAAAGVWAGGIMALAVVRLSGQWPTVGADIRPRFSRVAPWAFLASVGFGVVQAVQLLGSPDPLLHSSYGLILVAKALTIAAMVPLSWLAWRRLHLHLRAEAVLALVVVAAAAALTAFPVIPKEAREAAAEELSTVSARPSAVPAQGDLTMGGRAGPVMVGISIHPALPGRNTVTAYLASPANGSTRARLRTPGRSMPMSSCGSSCRTAVVDLRGGELVGVTVAGHGTAAYRLPTLPATSAAALIRSAARRMSQLHSYRDHQNLSGIRSSYRYLVPHQVFARTWFGNGPQDTVWLGRMLYRRESPTAHWRLQSRGVLAPVPYFSWQPFLPLVDSHVVGHARLAGNPVRVVTAFDGHGADPDPVWFTLYVDAAGRILRSQMWATNHFMEDRYSHFDQPVAMPRVPRA